MAAPRFEWIRKGWLLAGIIIVVAIWMFTRPSKEPESLIVPLGVEQAAIVTYAGPAIAVAPYKWGVAVNVRIAGVTEQAGGRVYDVRYLVNRGGTFDLKDYLVATDGSRLEALPSFKFTGDPKLSKELDARIQETEPIRVEVGGHYFEILGALVVMWLGWLFLLIFYKRPKRPAPTAPAPPEPTLAELLRAALAQLESGALDATGKAKFEMLLLRRWREELALEELSMSAAMHEIGRSPKTAEPLRQVQHWLHHRASSVKGEEVAGVLARFTVEPHPPEPAAQP